MTEKNREEDSFTRKMRMYERRQIAQREVYVNAIFEGSRRFDSAILFVSGGALLLSIAFLRDFVPEPTWNMRVLLVTSWALFVVAIICIVLSFHYSQNAYNQRVREIDIAMSTQDFSRLESTPDWGKRTNDLNDAALITFILGIVTSSLFAAIAVLFPAGI